MKEHVSASELDDWSSALDVLIEERGESYANALLEQLIGRSLGKMHYWNSDCVSMDVDVAMIMRASELTRWNAMVMVVGASKHGSELGGHISSYASSAILYEVGFNYFFKGSEGALGDLVLFQGHSSPGMYARSYLLDQFSQEALEHFRRESKGRGVSSYPHPWLMPDYWQFPTVSMGLGPLQGIYSAKLMKYLEARELLKPSNRQVWVYCGDGEMDEVESLGALGVASREGLDNLIFVINCNLVRLDGPCRGNGQIIQELSGYFKGFGWEVIKVVWSQAWLELVDKDKSGYLKSCLMALNDGQIQSMFVSQEALKAWFMEDSQRQVLVEGWEDSEFAKLVPGGHDIQLVANAYKQAVDAKKPCVILFLTEKGFGVPGVSGRNTSHNQKKLSDEQVAQYANFLNIPVATLDFHKPNDDTVAFMKEQRSKLNGPMPHRHMGDQSLEVPSLASFEPLLVSGEEREFSTTMAFVRCLNLMLRDDAIKQHIVPILADEGRTLGMEGLFRQIGIYAQGGQNYTPHDRMEVSYYKESANGQLLQEGINEAGAMSMWLAAATSYSTHQLPLIPIYAFYSMFGFQRVGDLIWAAADSRARGFLMGATAGRTTLGGEGLQHNDATSLLIASTIPNCKSYDPCYAYELAIIMQHGIEEMYHEKRDVFYYITIMNENYTHPEMPKDIVEGVIQGMYQIDGNEDNTIDLLASGTILRVAERSAKWIKDKLGIGINVWSVTSWSELQKEALIAKDLGKASYIDSCLGDRSQLVIAASDYVRALPGLLHEAIARPYVTMGTDGFGMSDTRESLREYYGISETLMIETILDALVEASLLDKSSADKWIKSRQRVSPLKDDRRES